MTDWLYTEIVYVKNGGSIGLGQDISPLGEDGAADNASEPIVTFSEELNLAISARRANKQIAFPVASIASVALAPGTSLVSVFQKHS